MQLLVERIDIGIGGLSLRFRDRGLMQIATEMNSLEGIKRTAAAA